MASPVFKSHYEIATPRLVVRSAVPNDAERCYQLLHKQFGGGNDLSPDIFRRRINKWAEAAAKGESAFMVIALQSTGEVMGYGGFNSLPRKPALDGSGKEVLVGDIGILIDERYQRQGYALEAVCAMSEFGFNYFGVGFMSLDTDLTNEALRQLMVALGLGHTEEKRQGWQAEGDEYPDVLWFEYDSQTWDKAKEGLKASGKWPL